MTPPKPWGPQKPRQPPGKVKVISPPLPTTLPQEAQIPPIKPVRRLVHWPLGLNPQLRHRDMQSQPGLPVIAGRNCRPGSSLPDPAERGASAPWPPTGLFPPGHHHSYPTLLGNPALSPGPVSVPTAHPGSISVVTLRLSPQSPSSLHLQLSSCPQKCQGLQSAGSVCGSGWPLNPRPGRSPLSFP